MDHEVDDMIAELAQKLYNEDGHSGNIYKKAPVWMLWAYEQKAQEIIEKGTPQVEIK